MTLDAAPPLSRTPDPTAAVFESERGPIWIAGEGQVVNVGTYMVCLLTFWLPPRQRLVGRGRVVLRTSDRSTPIVVLNAVPGPLAVADLLGDRVGRCRVAKGVREID